MISSKKFNFFRCRHHQFNKVIKLFRFLGFFSDLSKNNIIGYFRVVFNNFSWWRLIANKTNFKWVHKIISMRKWNFSIFEFNPDNLVYDLVAPFLNHFVGHIKLCIKNPDKNEPFFGQSFNSQIHDFLVAHSIIIKVKFRVGEHKSWIIPLASLNSPRWIHKNNIKMSKFFNKKIKI